jgi:peptidyl-prolyl cis-trans isomerase B (cyclophilin B)
VLYQRSFQQNIRQNSCIFAAKKFMKAIISTNKGEMHAELFAAAAPNTVANFVKLAQDGFYNGLKWHRVLTDFVIQGGCPNTREGASGMPGTGGQGYQIDCETSGESQYHDRGVLSMAHAGRNTGGSQFFVCHSRNNTAHLDGVHTVFGKVYEGLDVLDAIRQGDSIDSITIVEEA